eukprot:gnl/MRDRNA2_/MRDRNA2_86356_c0_seq1.p1 gnl/MRDRNA2_/MRDRNA2_86356_c0~~gnl/MRDRNA2_/MRDRNA2_86356_c0_seq1.p1  ORF type:complete len:905 (+),score=95.90 gnl/MRDRNA2_/MRDRNA2_86356_c0_seq1:359-2716(+)
MSAFFILSFLESLIASSKSPGDSSLWYVVFLAVFYWFLYVSVFFIRTWTQFTGNSRSSKYENVFMVAIRSSNFLPWFCVSFLLEHELSLGDHCGNGAIIAIVLGLCTQTFFSIIVPLFLQGAVRIGYIEGDMEYCEVENKAIETFLSIARKVILFSIYIGMAIHCISLIQKALAASASESDGVSYLQRPIVSVAFCMAQFYFVYFIIWLILTVRWLIPSLEWRCLENTMEICKGTVMFSMMLAVMFLCLGPQPSIFSLLGLAAIAQHMQFLMVFVMQVMTGMQARLDEDGNIRWQPEHPILIYFVSLLRMAGFIFSYGGFISGIVALCVARSQVISVDVDLSIPRPTLTTTRPSEAQVDRFVAFFEEPEALMPFYALFISALLKCCFQYVAFGFGKTDVELRDAEDNKYRLHFEQLTENQRTLKIVDDAGNVVQEPNSLTVDYATGLITPRSRQGPLICFKVKKRDRVKKFREVELVCAMVSPTTLEAVNKEKNSADSPLLTDPRGEAGYQVVNISDSAIEPATESNEQQRPKVDDDDREASYGEFCLEKIANCMRYILQLGSQSYFLFSFLMTLTMDLAEFHKLPEGSSLSTWTQCFAIVFATSPNWGAACAGCALMQARVSKGTLFAGFRVQGYLLGTISSLYLFSCIFISFIPVYVLLLCNTVSMLWSGCFLYHLAASLTFGISCAVTILLICKIVSKVRKCSGKTIDTHEEQVLVRYFQMAAVTFVLAAVNLVTAIRVQRGESYTEALWLTLTERTARSYVETQLANPTVRSVLTILWILL